MMYMYMYVQGAGLSLTGWGGGEGGGVISFSYYERGPGYFHWKIEEKQNQKKFLPVWFPHSCCITSDNLKF